jgi:WD40 repeat protein
MIYSVAFSPDGRWLASGDANGTVSLWDTNDPLQAQYLLYGHDARVWSVAFSPDGRWLASGSSDWTVRLWPLDTTDSDALDETDLEESARVLRGHGSGVLYVAFSPDGRWLVSGGSDWTVRLWEMSDSSVRRQLLGHESDVWSVAFSPECASSSEAPAERCEQWLASTSSTDPTLRLWPLAASSAGEMPDPAPDPIELRHSGFWGISVAFSPDRRWLVAGSVDKTVWVWPFAGDVSRLAAEPRVLRGHANRVWSVAFSPECASSPEASVQWCEQWLASGSADSTVRLWPLGPAGPVADPVVLRGHQGGVWSVAFSPDGRWLASGSSDGTVRLWPLDVGDPEAGVRVLPDYGSTVFAVAFSPDGRWLASGSADKIVRLWPLDVGGPAAEARELSGHRNAVHDVAFSPDGRWLASGSADRTVLLWSPSSSSSVDAGDPSAGPRVLRGHEASFWSVAFSSDGRWLASGDGDGTVWLWMADLGELADVGCQMARRNMTRREWDRYVLGEPYRKTCDRWPLEGE